MTSSSASTHVQMDSILMLEIGSVRTRASLVDIVERQYRLVATADHATTAEPSTGGDVGEGVRQALDELAEVVGHNFFDESGQLIVPSRGSGQGVDAVVLTLSLQADIRVVLVGLLPDLSLRSLRKLNESAPVRIVEELSLGDRRTDEARMDALCNAKPDILLVAGGTEGGAVDALERMLEVVGLGIHVMSSATKPQVLFMGNSAAASRVTDLLQGVAAVTTARNIRPSLEVEDLESGRVALNEMTASVLRSRLTGIEESLGWAGGVLTPAPLGFGTVVQLLGRSSPAKSGVVGVSLGAGSTILGAAFGSNMELSVRPDINLSYNAPKLLETVSIKEIIRWIPADVSEDLIRDFIFNLTLYPRTIPMTNEDLWIELAVAREIIRSVLRTAAPSWKVPFTWAWPGLLPPLDTVFGSGGVLAGVPKPGLAALVLLDAIQPPGIMRLKLDSQSMVCTLGAAARVNPLAVVQVLDSGSFPTLGSAVCPVGRARAGDPVMRYKLQYQDGRQIREDIRFGTITIVPLALGEKAQMNIQLHRQFDIGGGNGQGGTYTVEGGLVGLIIDARGRPMSMETEPGKARRQQEEWLHQIAA
jgi:hypothetical protein